MEGSFEVGKKYIGTNTGSIYECVHVRGTRSWMVCLSNGSNHIMESQAFRGREYTEPKKAYVLMFEEKHTKTLFSLVYTHEELSTKWRQHYLLEGHRLVLDHKFNYDPA